MTSATSMKPEWAGKLVVSALGEMKTDRVLPSRFIAAARCAPKNEAETSNRRCSVRCQEAGPALPGTTALVVGHQPLNVDGATQQKRRTSIALRAAAGLRYYPAEKLPNG